MNAPKFKIKAHVTVQLLKIADNGVPAYVKFAGAIFQAKTNEAEQKKFDLESAKYNKASPEERADMKVPQQPNPPKLAHVVNLETGEVQQIIIGSILESELKDAYPEDGYVGKGFEIKKQKPTGNKRYAMYQIAEIELPEEAQADVPVAGKGKKA